MKTIRIVPLIILLILLTSCQLALQKQDGDSLMIGTLLVPADRQPEEFALEPIYAKKITTEDGNLSFEFDGLPGEVILLYHELDEAKDQIESITGVGEKGTVYIGAGQAQTIDIEASYIVPHGEDRDYWLYLIYQSKDGEVYIDPTPYQRLSYSRNGEMSITFSENSQMMLKGQDIQYQSNYKVSITGKDYPHKLTIAQMDDQDRLVDRTTYPIDNPPDTITVKDGATHLVISQEGSDGEVAERSVITPETEAFEWPVLTENGFLNSFTVPID